MSEEQKWRECVVQDFKDTRDMIKRRDVPLALAFSFGLCSIVMWLVLFMCMEFKP